MEINVCRMRQSNPEFFVKTLTPNFVINLSRSRMDLPSDLK